MLARSEMNFRGFRVFVCFVSVVSSASSAFSSQAAPVTLTKDTAAIVLRRCEGWHRPGEIGPLSPVTYDEVKRHATQIGIVTSRRLMPPWKPVRGDFEGDRRLTAAELDLIQRWIAGGALEGPPSRPIRKPQPASPNK